MLIVDFKDIIHSKFREIQRLVDENERVTVRCDDGDLVSPSEDFLFNWIC